MHGHNPEKKCFLVDVPVLIWTTQWTILGARLELSTAPAVPVLFHIENTARFSGVFNPYFGAELACDLGNNWAAEISALSCRLGRDHAHASHNEDEL